MKRFLQFILCLCTVSIYAQTADVVEGCSPLEVKFTSPAMGAYYWDFDDLASSNLQNPEHIFTSAGEFNVTLFDGPGGTKIGEVKITVYPDPVISITSNPVKGCSPLTVDFTSMVEISPEMSILSYKWTFGDGNSSTLQNPTHIYQNSGIYTVSVAIETSIEECDKTVIFKDEITVEGVSASFTLDKLSECDVPATFTITNLSENSADNTYIWEYGDGTDIMGYDPGTKTFNEEGVFSISLTIINEVGCESTKTFNVTVGPPNFDFNAPEEVCINTDFKITNLANAVTYTWDFGANAFPNVSNQSEPMLKFLTSGIQIIKLTQETTIGCLKDTSFMINVQDPSAKFDYSPTPTCIVPAQIDFTAQNTNYTTYNWSIDGQNSPNINYSWELPKRDSLHLNWFDSLFVTLNIVTNIGCTATYEDTVLQRRPDAYYYVDNISGCAPHTVTFTDDTRSVEPITSWTWIYGDGTTETYTNNTPFSHTYTQPGEYYSQLIIENTLGCIDTSAGLWIYVGEQIPSTFTLDQSEICLGESINITMDNVDPRIDDWQIDTDDKRFNHCWKSNSASHEFVHAPGSYDITLNTVYNGCYWSETHTDAITVNGAKSNLSWMINCEDPKNVMFKSNSLGATSLSWDLQEENEMQADSFTYEFDTTGNYTVYLTAFDATSSCPESIDSAVIYVKEVEAKFMLPEVVCDNQEYTILADSSIDVHANCHKGYLWILPDHRPRELGTDTVEATFSKPGHNEVTLIVEDINGCTDTLTQSTISYGIEPSFVADQSTICLPMEVNFTNQTTSDTTIVSYEWSFGGTNEHESFTFPYVEPLPNDIAVSLIIEDEIGCMDTLIQYIDVYEITSGITLDNGPTICVGEEITFTAEDFNQGGSFLNFDWDFGPYGSSNNQTETILFDQNGIFPVTLDYTEDASGCQGEEEIVITAVMVPIADFTSPEDDEEFICAPAIIDFTNTSQTEGIVINRWNFSNGITSFENNPSNSFDKGTHEVELIVSSIHGCRDTIAKTYTLVGPEGDFDFDKNNICKGESITFTLKDTADLTSFIWDFGDGNSLENVAPVTHQFNFNPINGESKVDLILKSEETGCDLIVSYPITITEVLASFEVVDSSHCEGLAVFKNTSVGDVSTFIWDFGNGQTSNEINPTLLYDDVGTYDVTLTATDAAGICFDQVTKEVNLEEIEDFIMFPNVFSPNGDGLNDNFNVVITPGYEDVVKVLTFRIYDRWGELLYDNEQPDQGWTGIFKNDVLPATIYAYFIEVEITDCKNEVKKGNVTIVR